MLLGVAIDRKALEAQLEINRENGCVHCTECSDVRLVRRIMLSHYPMSISIKSAYGHIHGDCLYMYQIPLKL